MTDFIERENILSDGTRLCDMSEQDLKTLRGSIRRLMDTVGRTPHFRRKNKTNLDVLEEQQRIIGNELERRKMLRQVNIFGLFGYVHEYIPARCIHRFKDGVDINLSVNAPLIPVLLVNGQWHRCPGDRSPTEFWLWDDFYKFRVQKINDWGVISSYTDRLELPGYVVRAMLAAGATIENVADPLAPEFPFTVLSEEPPNP